MERDKLGVTFSQQPPAGPSPQVPQRAVAQDGHDRSQMPTWWTPTTGVPQPPPPERKRRLLVGTATGLGTLGTVLALVGAGPLAFLLGVAGLVCGVVGLARRSRPGLGVAGVGLGAAAMVLSVVVSVAPTASRPSSSAAPSTTPVPVATQPAVAPATPIPPPAPAKAITAREWQKIAKNPDAHIGESVIVYGYVTQFDTGTGTDQFRASVDGVKHARYYDYETNTLLSGDQSRLGDLVQDDLFRAEVVVGGSYTYSNTMGGSTTAPVLVVSKILTTGTAK